MRSTWIIQIDLHTMTNIFRRDVEQRGKGHVRQRLEGCGHKLRKAGSCQKLGEARKDSSLESSEEAWPCLDIRHRASSTVGKETSVAINHQVCGNELQ